MIGHELSGEYKITHGTTLALILPHWMKYVYKHDVMRFVRYAVEVWGIRQNYDDPEETALAGIAKTKKNSLSQLDNLHILKDVNVGDEK